MPGKTLLDIVGKVQPLDGSWGPPETKNTMLNNVPYAPFSKQDKLGRMADWTEGKDRERGGRQNYGGRGYRGRLRNAMIEEEPRANVH
jgi:translation initiation factor 3 subunit D